MAELPERSSLTRGRGHQITAGLMAVIIGSAAVAAIPFGRLQLPANPSFLPAFGALTFLTELLTAALLLSQAALTQERGPLRLGAAYLFSALTVIPYLMAFPGVFATVPLIGRTESPVWLWTAWHGGWAACVIWFALAPVAKLQRFDLVRTAGCVCLAVTALALLATAGLPWLPVLLVDGNYQRLNTLGFGPAVLGTTLLGTALVTLRLRLRDPLSLWLAVSSFVATLDVALTLFGGARFTLGWYFSRTLSLMTGAPMLIALLSDLMAKAGRVGQLNARLEEMLRTDVLTGVQNRRAFESAMDIEWRRSRRDRTAISLLMIDIDLFKGFNDRHGHPAGDECLRQVASTLASHIRRPADLAARLGGEEFALLLPATDEPGAAKLAERVRAAVAGLALSYGEIMLGRVTVSIGVATRRPSERVNDPATLVDAADRALYQAKNGGRNLVCVEPAVQWAAVA